MRSIRKRLIGHKLHSLVISAGLLPAFVFAVNPPPDGGYAGGNTVEGTQALLSLTSGVNNTALGFRALYHDTNGSDNSAEGFAPLTTRAVSTTQLRVSTRSIITARAIPTPPMALVLSLITQCFLEQRRRGFFAL